MDTCALDDVKNVRGLVGIAQSSDEPVIVFDGDDECLVVMRPAVFERILFDSDLLNCSDRASMLF